MPFTDSELDGFLDESLPAERMAAIEAALRDDEALRHRLATVVGRRDAGVHSLAAVWRRHRLTCPSREQLGSFALGVLDPGWEDYVRFHLEIVNCRYCQASLHDLKERHAASDDPATETRRSRYFQSSAGYLSSGGKR
jgi:hypothetical protein